MKYVYWDSNCFIGHLKNEENGREAREGVLQAVERGEAKIVTSAFTLVEVVKGKAREKDGPAYVRFDSGSKAALEECFSPDNGVLIVNVDLAVASKARQAVWDNNVDPKDAIHVGSALQFKNVAMADGDELVFHTFDRKLVKRANGCGGIRFCAPSLSEFPYQPSLDTEM